VQAIRARNAATAAAELETMPITRSAVAVSAELEVTRAELSQARVEIDTLNQYFRYDSASSLSFLSSNTFSTEKTNS
jgi:hypothetical protein